MTARRCSSRHRSRPSPPASLGSLSAVMTLGDSIFTARTAKGLSLRELARRCGISNPLISQIENGHIANPGFFTVSALAKALNLDLRSLGALQKEGN